MPKKKKPSPTSVTAESVLWHDAKIHFREGLDLSPTLNRTVGFLVYEDEKMIVLAHELTTAEDWLEGDMDYTKIPKPMLVQRIVLGTVKLSTEEGDNLDQVEAIQS